MIRIDDVHGSSGERVPKVTATAIATYASLVPSGEIITLLTYGVGGGRENSGLETRGDRQQTLIFGLGFDNYGQGFGDQLAIFHLIELNRRSLFSIRLCRSLCA